MNQADFEAELQREGYQSVWFSDVRSSSVEYFLLTAIT
jgi:hypothetical protein